jgi:hypothetical protein
MTFLNPFVLFGLTAAAIPIILHLLNIRKLRTIDFSTLTFLKELQKSKMRRVKIRQWLLLVLRTLLVMLIVFAFSRPALEGTLAGIGTHARTTIVIILDDTYSMSLQNERGVFLKQAQSAAFRLVDMLKEGDDAMFIRLSELPQATIAEPTHDLQRIRDAIRRTDASYKHRTVEDALRLSLSLLRQSKNFNKEVYILTDNQKTTALNPLNKSSTVGSLRPMAQSADRPEKLSNVKLFLVPLSDKPFENIGIEKVEIAPTLFQRGKPFPVRASVRNFGGARVQNFLVSMFLNGARVMQKSVTLDGGGRAAVDFIATPQRTGFLSGYVELEEDAFDGDNKNYFSVNVPGQLNVVLVSSDAKSSAYLRLALGVLNRDETSTTLALKEVAPGQLASATLAQANVVILSNAASLSSSQADQLAQFSSQGGGVILFAGDLLNIAQYNATLLPRLGLPALLPAQRRAVSSTAFVSFAKIDFDHPVFQGMFENAKGVREQKKNIESPKIFSSIRFASEKEIRSIVTLSDGTPFLWEKISHTSPRDVSERTPLEDSHRVLGFAVAPNTEWSDFPLKGIFVPLLYQTILYAASGGSSLVPSPTAAVGDRIDIPVPKFRKKTSGAQPVSSRTVRVVDPNGKEMIVQPSTADAGGLSTIIPFDKSSQPGVYAVVCSNDTLALVPVNIDPSESNGERTPFDEFAAMSQRYGIERNAVSVVKDPETIDAVVLQSRLGVELWKYFLMAALVVALIEMMVARESKQLS